MYRLLTFNVDYSDEHNVPALACFNQDEYNKWYLSPKGGANRTYMDEMIVYDDKLAKHQAYMKRRKDAGPRSANMSEWTPEQHKAMTTDVVGHPGNPPKKGVSWITAYLGNGGEYFQDGFEDYMTAQDYIDADIVKVTEVDESFYNHFHKADLASLSLCNIFDLEMEEIDW